ncbi:MAG: hypothetical protein OEW21_09530 [Betaproteobacteria bacterium]|nr:hypothetical protein [Betaproteobacteria bacterium]
MKKLILGATFAGFAAAASHAAFADEGVIRARLVVSSNNYELSFDDKAPYANRSAKSSYSMTGLGLTAVSAGGAYIDFVAQNSGSAKHDLWNNLAGNPPPQAFKREEAAVTLGVSTRMGEGASSAFLGYKTGTSTLDAPPLTFTWTKDIFESSGLFFGGGFAFPALNGNIGLNGALALMSGKWTDNDVPPYNNKADTTVGFSFGASYSYMFTGNVGMSIDWKYNAYSYNFAVYSVTVPAYTVTEKINSIGVNLLAQF